MRKNIFSAIVLVCFTSILSARAATGDAEEIGQDAKKLGNKIAEKSKDVAKKVAKGAKDVAKKVSKKTADTAKKIDKKIEEKLDE